MARTVDHETLAAALVGYREKLKQIDERMNEIRRKLGGKPAGLAPSQTQAKPRLSPEGRARIVAAARKRWAEARRAKAKGAKRAG